MAKRKGLAYVAICNTRGIFSIGVVNPDNKIIGINNTKVYSMACCILTDKAEMDKPMPTVDKIKNNNPTYKVHNDPKKGMSNQ